MNYCKLYVDDEWSTEEIQNLLDRGVSQFFGSSSVQAIAFENEHLLRSSDVKSSTYPIDRSRYYVEIEPDLHENIANEIFESGTARLVHWLRSQCDYVVASCDFEEYIVDQTGWNWTLEHPTPPD